MEGAWIPRHLRLAGVLAAVGAAVPVVLRRAREESWTEPRFLLWAALSAVFLGLFWWLSGRGCEHHHRRTVVALLHLLGVVSLVLIALGGTASGAVLPVLAVAVAGARLSRDAARWWMGLGSLALVPAFRLAGFPLSTAVLMALIFGALSLFVSYASRVAVRERSARQALEETNRELREARRLLERRARDAERLEIARELHDVMGHHLTALSLTLEAAARGPGDEVHDHVAEAQVLAKRLLRDTRRVVSALRSEPVEGLEHGLRRLATEVRTPRIHLELDGGAAIEDPASEQALLRCAQEIVTNAVRHSGADNLWLALTRTERRVELEAWDDGGGDGAPVAGHGLSGMRERIRALGGEVSWGGADAEGFSVEVWIPRAAERRA